MSLSFTRYANWTAPVLTSTGGGIGKRVKMLCVTPDCVVDLLRTSNPPTTLSFNGIPHDGRVIATHYNPDHQMLEFIIESEEFPLVHPGECLERFNVVITNHHGEAEKFLQEVHVNSLNGYLYSGPVRERVAKFLGMPDVAAHGDSLVVDSVPQESRV